MADQNPHLDRNPARDRIVSEINEALEAFDEIRAGERDAFIDSVGLQDDGEGIRTVVTIGTVDEHEAALRRKWSWLCPDLIEVEA